MTIPIYNSEIAPPAKRGMIAGLHAQFVGFGFAAANASYPGLPHLRSFIDADCCISGLVSVVHTPMGISSGVFL